MPGGCFHSFIAWVVPLGIKSLHGAASVPGRTGGSAEGRRLATTPPHFPCRVETTSERTSPEKAVGSSLRDIRQDVVTCRCRTPR